MSTRRQTILRVAALLTALGLTIYLISIREQARHLAAYGYPGIFLLALLSNATVLIPLPGLAVVFAMGSVFHPVGVALAAGTGGALGELSGYLAGFGGQAVVERADIYNKIVPWVQRYGGPVILILAAIPNPFFDLVGIAAGALKIPLHKFLLWCWPGQIIKMLLFAYSGSLSINWLLHP
ncbi:MAG: DedA family protein [Anaerolineae bacterium]|nr:MAG: DedA family protein [Anaerolineae bacterium]